MPENNEKGMTYAGSGVNYDVMDAFKRRAQELGATTYRNLKKLDKRFKNVTFIKESAGESAAIYACNMDGCVAHVEEGLGTKNIVAESMERTLRVNLLPRDSVLSPEKVETYCFNLFSGIGQCTAAMIINDLITVGAQPIGLNMHLAAGNAEWFKNTNRWEGILSGWKKACDLAVCAWGGGETPTLKGIIEPGTCLLSGSGWGIIPGKKILHGSRIRHGDKIIFYHGSGVHSNGFTLFRKIAEKLSDGFFTKLPSDQFYGDALLAPTPIYAAALNKALARNADIHYTANITGHGWRKIMRAEEKFCYTIDNVPEPQEIFQFIMKHGPVDDREAYGNFNMNAGFALFVAKDSVEKVLDAAAEEGINASEAGGVREAGKKSVVIEREGKPPIIFEEDEMKIR